MTDDMFALISALVFLVMCPVAMWLTERWS